MAVAVGVKVASEIASVALPMLLDKYHERDLVKQDVASLQPTVAKCSLLLQNLPPHQVGPLDLEIHGLQAALQDAHEMITSLVHAVPASALQPAVPERVAGKLLGGIKKGITATVEAGQDMMKAGSRHAQLTAINERLLHASLDLSVAASKLPPKSSMCVVQ
eukprot:COSAG05_NODE_2503_length_2969_cov_1.890125_2_plen_162_part_00